MIDFLKTINKATVGALAAAGLAVANDVLGFGLTMATQAVVTAAVVAVVVWVVPNMPAGDA